MKNYLFLIVLIIPFLCSCDTDENQPEIPLDEENFSAEIFFSEYIEGSSFNKALEIVNLTGNVINLETLDYSVKKQLNGSGNWVNELKLTGIISHNSVFVLANASANIPEIIETANQLKTGAPMDFNGNDPLGLFKNGILIDVIGFKDNSENFGFDMTLKRKKTSIEPNNIFDLEEWEVLEMDTVDGLGAY